MTFTCTGFLAVTPLRLSPDTTGTAMSHLHTDLQSRYTGGPYGNTAGNKRRKVFGKQKRAATNTIAAFAFHPGTRIVPSLP